MFNARNVGQRRRAAGGDQDMARRDALAMDAEGVWVFKTGMALKQLHPRVLQQVLVDAAQPRDLLLLGRHQAGPIERGRGNGPAKTGRVFQVFGVMRGLHQELFGHTTPNHASAAVAKALGNTDLGTQAGGDSRGAHTARAATDHKKVKVVGLHVGFRTNVRFILAGRATDHAHPGQ